MRWLKAVRPLTLPAAIAPVLIARSISDGSNLLFLSILLCAVLIQINTNLVNDLFDFLKGADTDERIGPQRTLAAGLIQIREMKFAIALVSFAIIILGTYVVYSGGKPIFIIGIISLLLSFLYTAGPFPIAYLGLGEVFVFLFFGPIATWGTVWILSKTHSNLAILHGIAPGMLSSALLVVNNIRDYRTDLKANKNTLIVRFGRKFGQLEFSFFLLFPLIFTAFILEMPLVLILIPFALIPIYQVFNFENEKELMPVLRSVILLLVAYTIITCL